MKKYLLLITIILLFFSSAWSQQLAFPTAEGYGKYTVGGRGGKVYEVTNLNDSGAGSLRAAVEASGPRTVVFRVSGTIYLYSNLTIRNPYITIAGQTAPGDGICIANHPLEIGANQVIIRYIRTRLGDLSGIVDDAMGSRFTKHIIIDHVSASWSVDETMSIYHCDSMTVQWCIIAESLFNANHPNDADPTQTAPHGFGGIWGSDYSTYHHNLIADNSSRNPRFASGSGYTDYRNNVIYNWGYNSCYGGEKQQVGDTNPEHSFTDINMVANYYKPGPATEPGQVTYRIANPGYRDVKTDYGKWYIADNTMEGNAQVTANNWDGGVQPAGGLADTSLIKLAEPWQSMPIKQQSAAEAYNTVLDLAGCSFPKRDAVDSTIIHDARTGTATYEGTYNQYHTVPDPSKKCGIIDSQNDVGGFPTLNSTTPPTDSDHDGMPDSWETAHGLNPNDASDGNLYTLDSSYTNLEVYLNSIIDIPTDIPVTGVSISSEYQDVSKNGTLQLTATINPSNASNQTVSWTSSDNSVATVSATGLVTGVSFGTANITATTQDGSFTDTKAITVKNIPVTGVSLPDTASVYTGLFLQLTPTISPSNASNQNISWSSSNTSIATVSATGVVTGVAAGTATITVTTEDGGFTDECVITVNKSTLPSPLFKLGFNENTGTTVNNAGSVNTTLAMSNTIPAWSTNVPVNGGASSVDFGTTTGNYYIETDSIINELTGLTNFTVTGWVNCRNSTTGSGGNRIVTWINNGGDGVDIVYASDGSLKVGINQWPDNTTAISSQGMIPTDPNASSSNWRFFAVTYDAASSSLNIYFGDNTTEASIDKSLTYNQGPVGTNIGKLAIGHLNDESERTSRTDRMFRGLIDNVEIYNKTLDLDQIRTIQNIGTVQAVSQELYPETNCTLYPNPVNTSATVSYQLATASNVDIKVYDIMGNQVATLSNGIKAPGKHIETFDASHLSNTYYFVRFTVTPQNGSKPAYTQVKKMILLNLNK